MRVDNYMQCDVTEEEWEVIITFFYPSAYVAIT